MRLAEHHHVVEAFASDRADEPLGMSTPPGRMRRGRMVADSHSAHERMLPAMVRFAGDDKFFVGSDYPHAKGFVELVRRTRECLASLPTKSVDKILCVNARKFHRIP